MRADLRSVACGPTSGLHLSAQSACRACYFSDGSLDGVGDFAGWREMLGICLDSDPEVVVATRRREADAGIARQRAKRPALDERGLERERKGCSCRTWRRLCDRSLLRDDCDGTFQVCFLKWELDDHESDGAACVTDRCDGDGDRNGDRFQNGLAAIFEDESQSGARCNEVGIVQCASRTLPTGTTGAVWALTDAIDLVVPIVPSSGRDRIGRCRNVLIRNQRRFEKLVFCGMWCRPSAELIEATRWTTLVSASGSPSRGRWR